MTSEIDFVFFAYALSEILGALFVAAVAVGANARHPRPHLRAWAVTWLADAVAVILGWVSFAGLAPGAAGEGLELLRLVVRYTQLVTFAAGARAILGHAPLPRFRAMLAGAIALGTLSALVPLPPGAATLFVRWVVFAVLFGTACLVTGSLILRRGIVESGVGGRLVGGALALTGIQYLHLGATRMARAWGHTTPDFYDRLGLLDFVFLSTLGLGLVLSLLEDEEKRRAVAEAARRADEQALERERDLLRDSEERWRRISEAAFEGIVFTQDGLIVDANPQLGQIFGCPAEQLIGRSVFDLVAPADRERVVQAYETGQTAILEYAAARPDGSTLRVETRARTLSVGGRPLWVTAVRDLTQRVRLEAELRRRETLSAMGSLVGGVAHEVRTPLFSLSATLDALEAGVGTPADQDELRALLRSQVQRLSNLMQDLLDYGRPPRLDVREVALGGVIARAMTSCAAAAARRQVQVEATGTAGTSPVSGDAARLEQVFQNLIANAVAHAPAGTAVRVRAEPRGPEIAVSVEDEGPGIPASDLPRLFEPFFSRRQGGTGLGLPIAQRIVEAHGGTLRAGNRAERGACFTVVLPVAGGERG